MIKKINILLVIISIIGSIYVVITKDRSLVYVLKDLSIILTINIIYILRNLFKIKIDDAINFIYIVFIFMAHFLGVICDLYGCIYWFDKFIHFLSGILSSLGAIYIMVKFRKNDNTFFSILCIIGFSFMVAGLWEIFEFTSSCLFGVDPQLVAKTGVSDTMGDIIVAFLGSVIVSMCYHYEFKYNKNLFIKKFINVI